MMVVVPATEWVDVVAMSVAAVSLIYAFCLMRENE
jgi:hypothetical protein